MYQLLGNQLGLGNQQGSGLGGLLSGCLKSSQNEQRLMAEKSQRNILKNILLKPPVIQSNLLLSVTLFPEKDMEKLWM